MSVNLLEESNVFIKVDMRKKKSAKSYIKFIINVALILFLCGVVYQVGLNFMANETLEPNVRYTTVNDKRLDYILKGSGEYTIVFDSAIGGTLQGWSPIIEELEDEVYMFAYNRYGYGYSSTDSEVDIEKQAEELKILLRKAGAPEPYILIGEEYGSLVLTSFAEKFKESVAGVMLINPLDEEEINNGQFAKESRILAFRRGIERLGSYFGLTSLLDKIDLDVSMDTFESALSKQELEEFNIQRVRTSYTGAVLNELNLLRDGNIEIYKDGIFNDIPYYILGDNKSSSLSSLGNPSLTTNITIDNAENFLGISNTEILVEQIRSLIEDVEDNI